MTPRRAAVAVLLCCLALAHGWQGAVAAARPLQQRTTSSAVTMKHHEYFQRLRRAESGRLRLCVFRSNNHIYGQVIDDSKDAVVCAASTMEADMRETYGGNCDAATAVGKRLGERALAKGV